MVSNVLSFLDFINGSIQSGLLSKVSTVEGNTEVMIEAPGAQLENIDIEYKDNTLYVTIDYGKEGLRTGKEKFYRYEKDVDVEKVTAKLKDGILKIVLPKKPEAQAQKIKIE